MFYVLSSRYNLPIIFIVINNNGITMGIDSETFGDIKEATDLALTYVDVIDI
jgi:hypothetical protein